MRENWARRSVAGALLGLFLLLTVGLGEATHICPVHDPALAAAMAAGPHDAHASMAGHEQMDAAQSHGDHQNGQDHAHCCCTGFACFTNAITLPSQRLELPDVAIVTSSAPELPEYARSAAVSAYFIPFANGPPTLSERSA
jgi:hypothetical protein